MTMERLDADRVIVLPESRDAADAATDSDAVLGAVPVPAADSAADSAAERAVPQTRREWLRAHRKMWTALRGFREVVLIGAVYSMYDLTRFLVAGDHDGAISHGSTLLRWEKDAGLAPEHALNKLFSAHLALGLPADYVYATLHYVVTPAVLIWMWRRHSSSYSTARTVLMVATIIGLIGFSLMPTAPPRLLAGFTDTMAKFSHYGWWSTAASAPRGLGGDTNQFAALPSLHVGWALWCGWQLWRHGTRPVVRAFGVLYPVVLSVDVMATANHYLIDVVAGVAVVLLAVAFVKVAAAVAARAGEWSRSRAPAGFPNAPA